MLVPPWPCSSPRNSHWPLLLGKLMIPSLPDVQQHNLPTSMPILISVSLSVDSPFSVPLHSLQFWRVSDVQLILVDHLDHTPRLVFSSSPTRQYGTSWHPSWIQPGYRSFVNHWDCRSLTEKKHVSLRLPSDIVCTALVPTPQTLLFRESRTPNLCLCQLTT